MVLLHQNWQFLFETISICLSLSDWHTSRRRPKSENWWEWTLTPLSRKYLVSFPPAVPWLARPSKLDPWDAVSIQRSQMVFFFFFRFPLGGAKREMGEMDSGMAHYGISWPVVCVCVLCNTVLYLGCYIQTCTSQQQCCNNLGTTCYVHLFPA